jgi:Leucine-rich repeat (LRR) protein
VLSPLIAAHSTGLTRLDISNNEIRDAGCLALASGLEGGSVLTHVDLSFNLIGEQGCLAVCGALSRGERLQCVSFAKNHLKVKHSHHHHRHSLTS